MNKKYIFILFFFILVMSCQKIKTGKDTIIEKNNIINGDLGNEFIIEKQMLSNNIENMMDPKIMFGEIFAFYETTEINYIDTNAQNDDGALLVLYDGNSLLSKNLFCNLILLSSHGKTEYYCFNKYEDDIWYIYKKAFFYEEMYTIENATVEETYFEYNNEKSFLYNYNDKKYNVELEINKVPAVVDFRGTKSLIDFIYENIKKDIVNANGI